MKCVVIYFSLTGNTEIVARAIGAGLKQAAGHCDIVPIKEAYPRRLQEYDLIGLGCPVMGFMEPGNVRAFIKDMRFVGGKHAFPFATHGTIGEYFAPSIIPRLKRQGLIVIGHWDCYADCYLPSMPDPYPTAGHPDEIDLKEAEAFGWEMAERSRRIYAGKTGLIPSPPAPPALSFADFQTRIRRLEEEMGVLSFQNVRPPRMEFDAARCTYPECRLCMDNCPVDGIDLTVTPPVIGQPCMRCAFCTKICPTGALSSIDEDGWTEAVTDRTIKMMPVFYLPALAEAEAEGRFRRLVPLEKVGLDTPLYLRTKGKHPQWIIGQGIP